MKPIKITTHLDETSAYALIQLLDDLREALCEAYGDDIAEMLKNASYSDRSQDLLDDEVDF